MTSSRGGAAHVGRKILMVTALPRPLLVPLGDQVCRWKSHSAVGHLRLQWDHTCHFRAFKSTPHPEGKYPGLLARRQEEPWDLLPKRQTVLAAASSPVLWRPEGHPSPMAAGLGMVALVHPSPIPVHQQHNTCHHQYLLSESGRMGQ